MNSLFAGHYFVFFSFLLSNFRLYSSHQTKLTRDAESEVEEDEVVVDMTTEKKKKQLNPVTTMLLHAADMRNDMRSYLWCRYM